MGHPLAIFEKIYVINLPSRRDRYREMSEQLKTIGLGFDSPFVELFEAVRPDSAGGFPSVGARGCFMSHLGILQKASGEGLSRILILEDDVNFHSDFLPRGAQVTSSLRRHAWSIFYGGYHFPEGSEAIEFDGGLVSSDTVIMLTHFVGFQGAAIGIAANYLEAMLQRPAGHPDGGPMHVDGAYSWLRRSHPHLLTYLAAPELGYQRSSRTDLSPPSWYDRAPVARDLVSLARKFKNMLRR
jgi:hypothetical protein